MDSELPASPVKAEKSLRVKKAAAGRAVCVDVSPQVLFTPSLFGNFNLKKKKFLSFGDLGKYNEDDFPASWRGNEKSTNQGTAKEEDAGGREGECPPKSRGGNQELVPAGSRGPTAS